MKVSLRNRADNESPSVISDLGWKYHHLGIPTTAQKPGERYLPALKMYVSGFETSPYGIEWMRFEEGSPVSKLIRTVPHVAFEVENLDEVLREHDFEVLSESSSPSDGVRVAMIVHNGAPVELMEFGG